MQWLVLVLRHAGSPKGLASGCCFWHEDIRQPGFYSFDLAAAIYVLRPELFRCAQVWPRIGKHSWYRRWILGDEGLFVDQLIDGEKD
jgi:hypothetical protein